jgi:hypothetical protein
MERGVQPVQPAQVVAAQALLNFEPARNPPKPLRHSDSTRPASIPGFPGLDIRPSLGAVFLDEKLSQPFEWRELDSTPLAAFPSCTSPILDQLCCDGDAATEFEIWNDILGVRVEAFVLALARGYRGVAVGLVGARDNAFCCDDFNQAIDAAA